jgi:DNA-binding beta-propeller fold protein YncE
MKFALRRTLASTAVIAALGASAGLAHAVSFEMVGRYDTGLADFENEVSAGETSALRGDRLYVTNAKDVSLDIVDVSNPAAPLLLKRVDLKPYGGGVNSVDLSSKNLIAVAVEAEKKTDPGTVVFLSPGGVVLRTVTVGALPDMVTFTPDGRRLLVANEGEPDCYGAGCTDPEGSVSVIDVVPLKPVLPVATIGFGFGGAAIPEGVRIFGPGATPAQDLEPEYITVSADGKTAWVTLQENNAVAKLDLEDLTVSAIFPLGYKDHSVPGNGLDASDKDKSINIQPWNKVLGMYQPDSIASYRVGGKTYLVTANEGDARDYDGFAEEERAKDVPALAAIAGVDDDKALGRLTVTTSPPGGDTSNLYVFGARSFSIRDAETGALVWDSGDQIEHITADAFPLNFNSTNDENNFDNRSDNKGPEPEGVAVGTIEGKTYAFVGLERVGGVVVFDITDPAAPGFVEYLTNRDFTAEPVGPDSGPEVIRFVDAAHSPNGRPTVVVSNEISGTVSLWSLSAP